MAQLIFLIPAYSNAVLAAVLPHVSEFAVKLNLPIKQPVAMEQIAWFRTARWPETKAIGGALTLTNGYWFAFERHGSVNGFHSPDCPYAVDETFDISKFYGQDHMTTNQAIAMAREALRKLGYTPEQTHSSGPPTEWEGPFDAKHGWEETFKPGHVPYCRATWVWPPRDIAPDGCLNVVQVAINMDRKSLAGMALIFARTNTFFPTNLLELDATPDEIDKECRKRMGSSSKMFFKSNALPHFPGAKRTADWRPGRHQSTFSVQRGGAVKPAPCEPWRWWVWRGGPTIISTSFREGSNAPWGTNWPPLNTPPCPFHLCFLRYLLSVH